MTAVYTPKNLAQPANQANADTTLTGPRFSPTTYAELPNWGADDHLAAWKAFLASAARLLEARKSSEKTGPLGVNAQLLEICELAHRQANSTTISTGAAAKVFFEGHFQPHRVEHDAPGGLLTGYYEPVLKGARMPAEGYGVPVYKRPPDLVNMVAESERGAKSHQFTHMRRTQHGLVPCLTRAEIEQGGLTGQGLELFYFQDPVDVFFMHVQGSGRVELPDGDMVRITYDGKNGYPYTSIGKHLIDTGAMTADAMSLQALTAWLKEDNGRAEAVMWENRSFVFFRELAGAEAASAMGVLQIPLQQDRSLAVDTAYHAIGTPIYVSAPTLAHAGPPGKFQRLMIAHDVGSAIKGPERGDIFFGSGETAGARAGITKHPCQFFVLLPSVDAAPTPPVARTP